MNTSGRIQGATILRDIGAGCGEEALRVVTKMNQMDEPWIPGRQRGKPVNVQYNLPIKFRLDSDAKTMKEGKRSSILRILNDAPPSPPPPPEPKDEIFRVVEEMPRFPGCEHLNVSVKEKTDCSNEKMLQYVYKNLVYPENAKRNGTHGTAVVQFVIDKDGSVVDIDIYRDLGDGCGEAARNVIETMSEMAEKWKPAIQHGKHVKVLYTLPVRFQLDSGNDKK